MQSIKTILHATDFSKCSEPALDLACMIARDQNARLIVLHVVPPMGPVVAGGNLSAVRRAECCEQDLKSYREEMQNKLQHLRLPALQIRPECILKEGDAAKEIIRSAENCTCDLIVMGTHGQTGEFPRLMGSVAKEVTEKAPFSVLTVKMPRAQWRHSPPTDAEEACVVI